MSNFEEDASLAYLKTVKSNNNTFFAQMERKKLTTNSNQNNNTNNNGNTTTDSHSSNNNQQNGNTTSNNKKPMQKALAMLYNYSAPSLPRHYLPSQEYCLEVSENFHKLRNRVLETRMELAKVIEAAEMDEDDQDEEKPKKKKKQSRRRGREEDLTNTNDENQDEEFENKNAQREAILARNTARRIFLQKESAGLFDSASSIVPKTYDRKLWSKMIFSTELSPLHLDTSLERELTRMLSQEEDVEPITIVPKQSTTAMLRLTPQVNVSFLSRLSPGFSNFLAETVCKRFSTIANSKETIKVELPATLPDDKKKVLEICVDATRVKLLPQNDAGDGSSTAAVADNSETEGMGKPRLSFGSSPSLTPSLSGNGNNNTSTLQIEGLVRFLTLLRHSGIGCWLYCSLCGVELPLSTEVSRCLQEILRICCQSLKSLFDLRPDLKDQIVDGAELTTTRESDKTPEITLAKLPEPLPPATATTALPEDPDSGKNNNNKNSNNNKKSEAPAAIAPSVQATIRIYDLNYFSVEDARTLLSLIIVIGKSFKQSNPALLPL